MSENYKEDGSVEAQLRNIETRLIKIHETLKVAMSFIIIFLIIIIVTVYYFPTF